MTRLPYARLKTYAGPILKGIYRPRVEGLENVPVSGGAILASNHRSALDSAFIPLVTDRGVTFVAKKEYFTGERLSQRVTARFFTAIGQVPVDRGNNRAAQAALDAALEVLRRGDLFGIYPEGTRSPDGRLYRGRTGVAWLALTAEVPVVPVAVINTQRAMPPGAKVPRVARIGVRFGPPLRFKEFAGQAGRNRARRAVTDRIMEAIGALSDQEYVPRHAPRPDAGQDSADNT
jgi:1-acyl-sn-glycerol-3-phosphate acyltransferase